MLRNKIAPNTRFNLTIVLSRKLLRSVASLRGCLKSWLLFRHPRKFKIKFLYSNDLILNIANKLKETVQKLKFLKGPHIHFVLHVTVSYGKLIV